MKVKKGMMLIIGILLVIGVFFFLNYDPESNKVRCEASVSNTFGFLKISQASCTVVDDKCFLPLNVQGLFSTDGVIKFDGKSQNFNIGNVFGSQTFTQEVCSSSDSVNVVLIKEGVQIDSREVSVS